MSDYRLRVYTAGRIPRHGNLIRISEEIRQCDVLFAFVTRENIHDVLFESGIAMAFNKRLYVYIQQDLGLEIGDLIPTHNYGAREVLVSRSTKEACKDFSRIIGRPFTYEG